VEIKESTIAARVRVAGLLISTGIFVEILTLRWNNPISFVVFLGLGGLLMFAGVVVYLLSLV
jgi:hypothetical protein